MATDVLVYNSTGLTATITMSSLVTLTTSTNNCWQGTVMDFGSPRSEVWLAKLQTTFSTTPTAGGTLDVYMAWSSVSASSTSDPFPGGCTGTNGNFPGASAVPADGLKQLDFIGSFIACATSSAQSQDIGTFVAKKRYGCPVVAMRTSATLSSTDAHHVLRFLDLRPQSQ